MISDICFALILGYLMLILHERSKHGQYLRREGAVHARAVQRAISAGGPLPPLPRLLVRLRAEPTGQRTPRDGWWPLAAIANQELKIVMDVYSTMQRRLEHYRQLGITLVFGFFALFSLIDTALFKSSDGVNRHAAEGIVMEVLVLSALFFGHHLLAMVHKNFEETGVTIQVIELSTGMFELAALVPDGPLLPADWPSGNADRDRAEFRQVDWRDDIIPQAQRIILIVGLIQAVYVWHEYGIAVLQAVRRLIG
jgi:hypothetical protein